MVLQTLLFIVLQLYLFHLYRKKKKKLTLSTTNLYTKVSPGTIGHCVTPSVPSAHGVPIYIKNIRKISYKQQQ